MAFETMVMNLTALNNISPPNITYHSNLLDIIANVENTTGDLIIFFMLSIIAIIIYLALTDNTPFQDFGYDYIRGLNITFSVCAILSSVLIEQGWSSNFYAVGLFTTLFFISYIAILIIENQE